MLNFCDLDIHQFNESDVREEIIQPIISYMGYRKGEINSVNREISLRYPKINLGRKKKNDPDLIGRADYIFEVADYGRWVLDAKAPSCKIDDDILWQTRSYAVHPEVAARCYAICNGKTFEVYDTNKRPENSLILRKNIIELCNESHDLFSLISPEGFKKTFINPIINLSKPIMMPYVNNVKISNGYIEFTEFKTSAQFEEITKMSIGKRHFISGDVFRDEGGRIACTIDFQAGDGKTQSIYNIMNYGTALFYENKDMISFDEVLEFVGFFEVEAPSGLQLPLPNGQLLPLPFAVAMKARSQIVGRLIDKKFLGKAFININGVASGLTIPMEQFGDVVLHLDW